MRQGIGGTTAAEDCDVPLTAGSPAAWVRMGLNNNVYECSALQLFDFQMRNLFQ